MLKSETGLVLSHGQKIWKKKSVFKNLKNKWKRVRHFQTVLKRKTEQQSKIVFFVGKRYFEEKKKQKKHFVSFPCLLYMTSTTTGSSFSFNAVMFSSQQMPLRASQSRYFTTIWTFKSQPYKTVTLICECMIPWDV